MWARSSIFFVPVRAHDLADLCGCILHAVGVRAGLDRLHGAAERLQLLRNERCDAIDPLDVAAAGFDVAKLFERIEQRLLVLSREGLDLIALRRRGRG
jgi:hypothetical protein